MWSIYGILRQANTLKVTVCIYIVNTRKISNSHIKLRRKESEDTVRANCRVRECEIPLILSINFKNLENE